MKYLNVLSHIIYITVEITQHKTIVYILDYFNQQLCLVYITTGVSCK